MISAAIGILTRNDIDRVSYSSRPYSVSRRHGRGRPRRRRSHHHRRVIPHRRLYDGRVHHHNERICMYVYVTIIYIQSTTIPKCRMVYSIEYECCSLSGYRGPRFFVSLHPPFCSRMSPILYSGRFKSPLFTLLVLSQFVLC